MNYDIDYYKDEVHCLFAEKKDLQEQIKHLNKMIETKNKRIKQLNDNNKELKALLKEYEYELGLQELENTTICDLD
ncbi:MAG: hypothetical protein J6T15_03935 [Bacilli bacterium]|nr:hypothetical protein [Bacilli bacterium]